jgi:hypothetical protein
LAASSTAASCRWCRRRAARNTSDNSITCSGSSRPRQNARKYTALSVRTKRPGVSASGSTRTARPLHRQRSPRPRPARSRGISRRRRTFAPARAVSAPRFSPVGENGGQEGACLPPPPSYHSPYRAPYCRGGVEEGACLVRDNLVGEEACALRGVTLHRERHEQRKGLRDALLLRREPPLLPHANRVSVQ